MADTAKGADAVEAEASGALFTFEHNGETYSLKPASKIKVGALRKAQSAPDELSAMFAILEAVAEEDALAAIDDMTVEQLTGMFADFQRQGGVSLPE